MQRFVAGGSLEAAHEVTNAHAVLAGDILKAKLLGKMLLQPLLNLQYGHVLMQFLTAEANNAGGIAALYFVQGIACDRLGYLASAELFDQVDGQIAAGGDACGAIDVVRIGDVFVLAQNYFGKALAEFLEKPPVGGRFPAIQQACRSYPEYSGRFGADQRTACMLGLKPGDDVRIALEHLVKIAPEGREHDQLWAECTERGVGSDAILAEAGHGQGIRGNDRGAKAGGQSLASAPAVAQTGHMEKILGLHQGRGDDAVSGKYGYLAQGRQGGVDKGHGQTHFYRLYRPLYD